MDAYRNATATIAVDSVSSNRVRPPRYYRPELDALRLLAFLAVFVHHGMYNISPTLSICGGFGLSLFFFLSSFLITELLQREREASGTVNIKAFYLRRALRIWPLYFGFLLFAYLVGLVFPSHSLPLSCLSAFTFMAGNWYIAAFGFPVTFIGYLWSISVEEQFYLIWPAINSKLSRKGIFVAMLSILPISAISVLIICAKGGSPAQSVWTNSLVEFQFFALGSITALICRMRTFSAGIGVRVALLMMAAALWVTAAFTGIDARVPRNGVAPMIGYWMVGAGCLCLFLAFYNINRGWIPRWAIYLGKISYGLYVFHQFALEVAEHLMNRLPGFDSVTHHRAFGIGHLAGGLALTTVLAAISYQFFERPFLRMKERHAVVLSRAA